MCLNPQQKSHLPSPRRRVGPEAAAHGHLGSDREHPWHQEHPQPTLPWQLQQINDEGKGSFLI